MKTNLILTLFVLFSAATTFSQAYTLNQLDSNGKKTGWWITYLDDDLRVLNDSVGAKLCMYNYYINSIYLYRFGEGYGSKKSPVIFPAKNELTWGKYNLLNGKYSTTYKNGNTRSVLTASEGFMTNFKSYYSTGQLKFDIVISNDCGAPQQHCIIEYNKDGSIKRESRTWLPKDESIQRD